MLAGRDIIYMCTCMYIYVCCIYTTYTYIYIYIHTHIKVLASGFQPKYGYASSFFVIVLLEVYLVFIPPINFKFC